VHMFDRRGCGKAGPQIIQALDRLVDCAALGISGIGDQAVPCRKTTKSAGRCTADGNNIKPLRTGFACFPGSFRFKHLRYHTASKCGMRSPALTGNRNLSRAHDSSSPRGTLPFGAALLLSPTWLMEPADVPDNRNSSDKSGRKTWAEKLDWSDNGIAATAVA